MKYWVLILLLLLYSCGSPQKAKTLNSASILQHDEAVQEVNEQTADTTLFLKSTDPADSVWIGALDRIPLPPTVGQGSPINVYFKYKQPIKGYEVTARWMLSNARSWDGYIVMNFRDTNSGTSFHISSDEYANFNTDEVALADNFRGYSDGDVYYFEYPSPEEWVWRDSLHLLGYTLRLFNFSTWILTAKTNCSFPSGKTISPTITIRYIKSEITPLSNRIMYRSTDFRAILR